MKENTKVRAQEIVASYELPMSSAEGKGQKIKFKSFHYVPNLLTSLLSTVFMVYLLTRRHQLTPDILHFVTCLQEDLQHMLWLFVVWICLRQPYCVQDGIMACVELFLAHLVAGSLAGCLLQYGLLIAVFCLKQQKTFIAIFIVIYLTVTCWVNLTDYLYNGLIMEYYHDEFFVSSFSYKTHQFVLVGLVAVTGSELMSPSELTENRPKLITHLHRTQIPVSLSLLLTFLYELTWYTPQKRLKVFRTEINKVLLTIAYLNLASLILMSWMWQLGKQIKYLQQQKEQSAKEQRKHYEDYVARVKKYNTNQNLQPFTIKYPKSDAEKGIAEFEKKGFSDQSVSDVLSYGINKFFVFLDSNQYLTEKSYKREISKISNQSAVVFFIVV